MPEVGTTWKNLATLEIVKIVWSDFRETVGYVNLHGAARERSAKAKRFLKAYAPY